MRIELHMRYPIYATFRNACIALVGAFVLCSAHVAVSTFVWYRADEHCNYLLLPRWYHIYTNVSVFCSRS